MENVEKLVSCVKNKMTDLFTGAHVQRTLGKWAAAYAAVELRMWPQLKGQAVPLNAETWTEVTGLHEVPPELTRLVDTENEKVLGQVAVHARFMASQGLRSFVELGRRLYALSLTLPAKPFPVRVESFLDTSAACTAACNHDKALGVTMAYLIHVLPANKAARVLPAVGSLTATPLTWSTPGTVQTITWEPASSLDNTAGPRAFWGVLANQSVNQTHLARFDARHGVSEWALPPLDTRLGGVKWCVGVTPFKPVSKVVIVCERGATLADVFTDSNDGSEVRFTETVAWEPVHAPSQSMTVSMVANFVCWLNDASTLVALDLHTLSIQTDVDTLALLADDILKSQAPAAQMNFIYTNGEVIACLPADQDIVAVTGSPRCIDVFTASYDWWRLHRLPDNTFHALVVGVHVSAGFTVTHVSE